MMTQQPEEYGRVRDSYPPGTVLGHKYGGRARRQFINYLLSIVLIDKLRRMLARGFQHIDGALLNEDGTPVVQNLTIEKGKRKFVKVFRSQVVGRRIVPDGDIEAVMIPIPASQKLLELVQRELIWQKGVQIRGKLVAAGVVYFPNRLRVGGDPLGLPPHLQEVGKDFEPLVATGDPGQDSFRIRVVQMVFRRRTLFGWRISARVGLVVNHPRSVPEAIYEEVTLLRAGQEPNYPAALEVVERLVRWAQPA